MEDNPAIPVMLSKRRKPRREASINTREREPHSNFAKTIISMDA